MGRPPATEHGTYGYGRANKCKCDPCREAVSKYMKGIKFDHARGIKRRVPADPARRKIRSLLDAGARPNQIQIAAGFTDAVYSNIMVGKTDRGPAATIERATALKIVGLTVDKVLAVPTMHSNIGVIRRIQALQYMGHSPHKIAEGIGVSTAQLYQYTWGQECYTRTIESVHAAYVEMRRTPGDSGFARWKAYREGWFPPMSWDDETIDDPATEPYLPACIVEVCTREVMEANLCKRHHELVTKAGGFRESRRYRVAVGKVAARRQNNSARARNEIADLIAVNVPLPHIATQLGLTLEYVERLAKEGPAA